MSSTIIRNVTLINRGTSIVTDILIKGERIERIGPALKVQGMCTEINGEGLWLMPGIIDDQVHFREPGLTHKADIASESEAAITGGVTTFMEMPNTRPATLTQSLLQEKYDRAAATSYANYSFFMGTSLENYDEVMRTNHGQVCGLKIFMGSSTGDMLVDDPGVLERIFSQFPSLIATHCEDEATVKQRLEEYKAQYGDEITPEMHPQIRNVDACYLSSSFAVNLAKKHGTRLHILHLTTAKELDLFDNQTPLRHKKITSEVCVHHLTFNDRDYRLLGNQIKCNPAIKSAADQAALLPALLDNRLDIVATDHAPHTAEEKSQPYLHSPAGLPLVQHSLNAMMELHWEGKISMEKVVEKMCHAPADCFRVIDRGYADEGFFADLVLVDPGKRWVVSKENIRYKCGWSPFEGHTFRGKVRSTFLNGAEVYNEGGLLRQGIGQRVQFDPVRV
jgi:dihydroorotase